MHGLAEIKRMNEPQFLNSETMFGKINYSATKKTTNRTDPHKSCETVGQVMRRYTDDYEAWCEATNDIQDIECLAIAVNDMQLLIEALKAK